MSKKIEDLRKAADAARILSENAPSDAALADAAKKAADALSEAEAAAAPPPAKAKTKRVRVIADHEEHKINDVLTLPEGEADQAVTMGWADDDATAVKYAAGLDSGTADAA